MGFNKDFEVQGLRARLCCRKISDSIFWLYYFTPRWLAGAIPCPNKVQKKYTKEKIETNKRRKHFFHTFFYLLGEWTNQRYVPKRSVVPKAPDSKMMLLVRRTLPDKTRFTENLSIYLSPPAPNSPLQNPSNFGATASHWLLYLLLFFFFFLIFNRMDAWSLMRGDAFIHFVCGNRRVNIRLGVLLLILKSPHYQDKTFRRQPPTKENKQKIKTSTKQKPSPCQQRCLLEVLRGGEPECFHCLL